MTNEVPAKGAFWQFAVQAWRQPGVERACLALQDSFSVPVTAVLLGGWLGRAGYPADEALARQAMALVEEWEAQRLAPLRALRRQVAARAEWREWKRLLQDAELEGERLLLETLEQLVGQHPRAAQPTITLHAWWLLLVPQGASCEGITALLQQLGELLVPPDAAQAQ